jgi:hypothetical protein
MKHRLGVDEGFNQIITIGFENIHLFQYKE